MTQETLHELFVEQLRDIYDAEKQLTKALPKLAKAATSEDLVTAITAHLEETQQQVSRLEEVFSEIGIPAKGKPCKAMKGLIEEGSEAAGEEEGPFRDLAIIAAAQKVEHYEMSAYGTARTIAEKLGLEKVVELLEQTEEEEKNADSTLSDVAGQLYDMDEESEDAEMASSGRKQAKSQGDMKGTRKRAASR
jgi:ferritin-like metal-binding protein YciE